MRMNKQFGLLVATIALTIVQNTARGQPQRHRSRKLPRSLPSHVGRPGMAKLSRPRRASDFSWNAPAALSPAQELAYHSDGGTPTASGVSFYAVPEPQPKLLHKHDLVTIVIREDSNFSSQGTTDLKRNADINAQIIDYLQLKLAPLSLLPRQPTNPLELKGQTNRDFKGDATVDRTDSLTANITAVVVDVKPNGTLVLQATKSIKTDDEEQQFVLTGTCRVEDITADNTVLSTQMYGLSLDKQHKGAVKDTTNRSIIHRLFDMINPF